MLCMDDRSCQFVRYLIAPACNTAADWHCLLRHSSPSDYDKPYRVRRRRCVDISPQTNVHETITNAMRSSGQGNCLGLLVFLLIRTAACDSRGHLMLLFIYKHLGSW